MDRIGAIIPVINDNIRQVTGMDGAYFNVCEKITTERKVAFVSKMATEVQKGVFFDDSEKINVIHYLDSMSSEKDNEKGFGSKPLFTEIYSLVTLVFIANKDNVLEQKSVMQSLLYAYPDTLSKANKNRLALRYIGIAVTGASFNKNQIFDEEFTGNRHTMEDCSILLSISYNVELSYDRNCEMLSCELDKMEVLPKTTCGVYEDSDSIWGGTPNEF